MDNSVWVPMLLATLFTGANNNYDHINYIGKYTKYFKYGSDE